MVPLMRTFLPNSSPRLRRLGTDQYQEIVRVYSFCIMTQQAAMRRQYKIMRDGICQRGAKNVQFFIVLHYANIVIVLLISFVMSHYHYTVLTHRSPPTPGFGRLLSSNSARPAQYGQSSGAWDEVSSGMHSPETPGFPFGALPHVPNSHDVIQDTCLRPRAVACAVRWMVCP